MRWLGVGAMALVRAWLVVVAVAGLAWALVELAPGTTGERAARAAGVLPPDDAPAPLRRAAIAAATRELGLDGSAGARLLACVGAVARLDLGRSWRDGAAVSARLADGAATTVGLGLGALVLAFAGGSLVGAAAASAPRSRRARILAVATALAIAVPPVWLAVLLLRLGDGAALAVLALALAPMAVIAGHVRAALLAVADAPLAVAVRARGAGPRTLLRHAAALALPRLTPLLPATVGYLAGAALIVERAFGLHGLGALLLDAAARGDAPVVVGVSAVVAGAVSLAASVAVAIARTADPRLEVSSRG